MHLILRQLLSWELYCYPILLIHFESLDTYLSPHRLFLKVLSHSTDITSCSVKLKFVSLISCVFIISLIFFKCLERYLERWNWWHSGIPVGRRLHDSFEFLICKASSSNSRASLWPRTVPNMHSAKRGRCFTLHGKHLEDKKEILSFFLFCSLPNIYSNIINCVLYQ